MRLARAAGVVLTILLLSAPVASGQLSASSEAGHLWLATETESGAGIWHVPVRSGRSAAGSGTVRFAYALETAPVAMAARGDRLALLFERDDGSVMVRGLAAEPTEAGWQNASRGRLEAMPALEAGGEVLDAAWNGAGLFVLASGEDDGALWRLAGDEWEAVALPDLGAGSASGLVALGSEEMGLLVDAGAGRSLWRGRDTEEGWRWSPDAVGLERLGGWIGPAGGGSLIGIEHAEDGGGVIRRQVDGEVYRVGALPAWCTGPAGVMLADERIVAIEARGSDPPRIFEMSTLSGRVFADGEAEVQAPTIGRDLRLMVAALLVVVFMVIAMVGVRMPPAPEIPAGWMVAPALARVLAFSGDLLVAGLVVSAVTGEGLARTLWLEPGMGADGAINLFMVMAVGFAHATAMESLVGASVGKLVAGCRVVAAEGGRAGPLRIAIRNAMKWFLPACLLMAWVDPFGRHTGDALGRTVVVMGPIEES